MTTTPLKKKNKIEYATWQRIGKISLEVIAMLLLITFIAPFIIILINASKTGPEIVLSPLSMPTTWGQIWYNIVDIFGRRNVNYFQSFLNSVIITSISLVAIGVFSGMAAWVLVRTKTRYSTVIFLLFLAGLVIPFQVVMLPFVRLLQTLRNVTGIPFRNTYHGIILAYIGFGAPLSIFLFHGFIKSIPMDIEEAAIIDGCTKPQVFFKIILPILKPIFMTLLVLNGLWIWNDYLLPSLVLTDSRKIQTIPLGVANLAGFYDKEWGLILTGVVLAVIPMIILFLVAQKYIIKGMTSGAIK
jgi:raffinose/stachyose/melibiose transport system permease protein